MWPFKVSFLVAVAVSLSQWAVGAPGGVDFSRQHTGNAYDIAVDGQGRIVAVGNFDRGIMRLQPNGALDTSFTTTVDTPYASAVVIDSGNRIVIGGSFTRVNGALPARLARLNPDGSLDNSFGISPENTVTHLARQPNGAMLMAGWFEAVSHNGVRVGRPGLARVTPTGGLDGSFADMKGPWPSRSVQCVVAQADGKVLIGGSFQSFAGIAGPNLVRVNEDMSRDTNFNADINGTVMSVAVQPDGKILVAGYFTVTGELIRHSLVRLHSDGTLDESFNAGIKWYGDVEHVRVDSAGRIYIAGALREVGGSPRIGLARLHADGELDTGFEPPANLLGGIFAMAVQPDDHLLIDGWFDAYPLRRLARLIGGPAPPAAPTIRAQPTNETINAGSQAELSVIAKGSPHLYYQWQLDGTNLPGATDWKLQIFQTMPWHAGTYRVVVSNEIGTATSEPAVLTVNAFAPGFFTQPTNLALLEGQTARFRSFATGAPPPKYQWHFDGQPIAGPPFQATLSISNVTFADAGNYYVVASNLLGTATSVVAQLTVSAAATNAGAVDTSFNPEWRGGFVWSYPVAAAVMDGVGNIYVAQEYRIWKRLPNGRLDGTFTSSLSGPVQSMAAQPDGKILVGGDFNERLIRLHPNGSRDTNFFAAAFGPSVMSTLAVQPDGKILYAGPPGPYGTMLGRLHPNGAPDLNFRGITSQPVDGGVAPPPAPNGPYEVIVQPDGKILFAWASGLIRLLPNGAQDWDFAPHLPPPGAPFPIALQSDGKILAGMIRLNADGSRDPSFTGSVVGGTSALKIQPDGQVLVGAFGSLYRLRTNGALDTNFVIGRLTQPSNKITHIFLNANGKPVVLGGFADFNGYDRDGLVRLLADPPAPAHVTRQPMSLTVNRGQVARFSVDASCSPMPTFQWMYDNAPLEGETSPWLVITNAQLSDALAPYSVVVSNALGSNSSAAVSLTMSPAPTNAGNVDVDFFAGVPNDEVLASARQPDGKLIIGGRFTRVGDVPRQLVARLNADGSLDETFDAGVITNSYTAPPPAVYALALLPDGNILIGGQFHRFGTGASETYRNGLARLRANGTLDTNFNGLMASIGSPIRAVTLQKDGKILFVGGSPASVVGGYLGRCNADGSQDQNFFYGQYGVNTVAVQADGAIYAGGTFGVHKLRTNGTIERTFSGITRGVDALTLLPEVILVGGSFNLGTYRYLAALDYAGSPIASRWVHNISHPVRLIAPDGFGRILVAGTFTNINGRPLKGLARFFRDGKLDTNFNSAAFNGQVRTLTTADDEHAFYAGGEFTEVSRCYRPGTVRLFAGVVTTPFFSTQPQNHSVGAGHELEISATVICPPGTLFQWQRDGVDVDGATNSTLRIRNPQVGQSGNYRLSAQNEFGAVTSAVAVVTITPAPTMPGNNDVAFYPDDAATNVTWRIALQPDGKLLVLGGDAEARPVKRLLADGTMDQTFNAVFPALRTFGNAIALQPDGKIVLAITTNWVGGARSQVVRLNSDGSLDNSFSPADAGGQVRAVLLEPDGGVLISGFFSSINGTLRNHVARVDANGLLVPSYIPDLGTGFRQALIARQPDGKVVVAREFYSVSSLRSSVTRLEHDGTLDTDFVVTAYSNSCMPSPCRATAASWWQEISQTCRARRAVGWCGCCPAEKLMLASIRPPRQTW